MSPQQAASFRRAHARAHSSRLPHRTKHIRPLHTRGCTQALGADCQSLSLSAPPRPATAPGTDRWTARAHTHIQTRWSLRADEARTLDEANSEQRGQGQTERRHLEKHAAAELPPTPPHPAPHSSLFVRLPDKERGAGRGWQLDDDLTTSVS